MRFTGAKRLVFQACKQHVGGGVNRGKLAPRAANISKLATLVNNIVFCRGRHMHGADGLFV